MLKKYSSLSEVRAAFEDGRESCASLVDYYLGQAVRHSHLNAYVDLYDIEAQKRAKELDQKFLDNPSSVGRLFGMVISIKDVLSYKNHALSAASKMLQGFVANYTATAVQRLLDEDAIILGMLNCDEFGMGSSNETSIYGPVKNAYDPSRVPGGSSGGSAVAVQADTCLAALGSDTGGSVRQPAAFCGLYGLKPSYGRVSRHGLIAYASSFDCVGVLSSSVEDAALILEVISGKDEYDATVSERPVEQYSAFKKFERSAKIVCFKEALDEDALDPLVYAKTAAWIERLKKDGHEVELTSFDMMDMLVPAYYVLTTAEASSNLSRYDGIHYGYRCLDAEDLKSTYVKSRTEGFGEEVKRRIMLGTFVLSSGYYEAYYSKAQKARRLVLEKLNQLFNDYDFILMPTSPTPAFKLCEVMDDPVKMYLADVFTVMANLTGLPAMNIPLERIENELPVGVQLMADKFSEAKLLSFCQMLNRQTIVK